VIKSGLVYDESRLNKSRISVAWASANTWTDGSLYGTVEFQFSWAEIVERNPHIYWVEAMTDYSPTAFRFLLSDREITSRQLQPYDPRRDDGPLRMRDGKWYRRGNMTSEFMITADLRLRRCIGIDFVKHHHRHCSLYGSSCPDINRQPQPHRTGGMLLATCSPTTSIPSTSTCVPGACATSTIC